MIYGVIPKSEEKNLYTTLGAIIRGNTVYKIG